MLDTDLELLPDLIERHEFNIVAVEADWPDAATIDRYVRHRQKREGETPAFERFPGGDAASGRDAAG